MQIKLHTADHYKDFGSLAIKLPMNSNKKYNNSELFNLSYTTEEQAISNYINLLLTRRGERYMQPNFGVGLYYYLFEQNSENIKHLLQSEITSQADLWLPYIINDSIVITDYEQFNGDAKQGLNIIINFRVTESGANRSISVFPGINTPFNVDIT